MNWPKVEILDEKGNKVLAQAPVIVSASRATDIPTFYSDWFVERWKIGYVKWKNPFNNTFSYISFQNTKAVVFWTKNPRPLMRHLDFLQSNVKNFYFQYSLNDYEKEEYEGRIAPLQTRIETFKALSREIGKEKVIWRFDPLLLSDCITVDDLLSRIKHIGNMLLGFTDKLVISFADISTYKKVTRNLNSAGINYIEFTEPLMRQVAEGIQKLNNAWGFSLATCAENIDLSGFGITHNKCIDDDLLIKLFAQDKILMKFLGVSDELLLFEEGKKRNIKDTGQREACGCIMSKDIGEYNTCPHECIYCYANTSRETALANFKGHGKNPIAETITGI